MRACGHCVSPSSDWRQKDLAVWDADNMPPKSHTQRRKSGVVLLLLLLLR